MHDELEGAGMWEDSVDTAPQKMGEKFSEDLGSLLFSKDA